MWWYKLQSQHSGSRGRRKDLCEMGKKPSLCREFQASWGYKGDSVSKDQTIKKSHFQLQALTIPFVKIFMYREAASFHRYGLFRNAPSAHPAEQFGGMWLMLRDFLRNESNKII